MVSTHEAQERVSAALRLRAWVLDLLVANTEQQLSPCPAVPPEAWRTFLKREKCAFTLSTPTFLQLLDAKSRHIVVEMSRAELNHVELVDEQIGILAALALSKGWRLVVLKGGAGRTMGAPPLYLSDLDVLADPETAIVLARELDRTGYAVGQAAAHHYPVRTSPTGIDIEIHSTVLGLEMHRVWEGVTKTAVPGLWTLGPADHLEHLLIHSTQQHVGRRGVMRELLLIGNAIARTTSREQAEVQAKLLAKGSVVALQQHALAKALLHRGRRACHDPFAHTAAVAYVLHEHVKPLPLPRWFFDIVEESSYITSAKECGQWDQPGPSTLHLPSAVPALALLRHYAPSAERWLRKTIRFLPQHIAFPLVAAVLGLAVSVAHPRAGLGVRVT